MRKPQIAKYDSYWVLLEDYKWSVANKSKELSLGELYMLGRKTSLAKAFITNESRINESYNILLEDESLMEAVEYQAASDILNSEEYKLDEGFRDFTKAVFGEKIVGAIEKMPSKMYTIGVDLLDKGKDLWDKSIDSFKAFLDNVKEITKSIIDVMKNFLSKVWDLIKEGAKKAGKFIFGKKVDKLEALASKLNAANEAEDGESLGTHENYKEELSTASTEYSDMVKKYFKRDKFEQIEQQAEDAAEELKNVKSSGEKINDSINTVIYSSFIGLYSISESEEIENLFNFVNEADGDSHNDHAKQSKVVKWIQSIVMWILSPIGSCVEYLTKNVTKVAMSVPSMITKGVKNATKYVHVPTVAAILAGIATDTFAIISHGSGGHGGTHESQVFEKEELVSWKDGVEEVAKTATSAIAGFAMSIAIHMVPGLSIVFEAIVVAGLVMMFFGWMAEQSETWKKFVPNLCVEFFHWLH